MVAVVSNGAPLPERPNRRWEKVVSPVGQTPLAVTFLSPTFTGFWTHWDGRPVPCSGEDRCEHCQQGKGTRWTGYAAVWSDLVRGPRVLMISEGAARQLLPIGVKNGGLRGLSFYLQRTGDKPNSPIYVKERGKVPEDRLPPDFDILPSLHHLWNVSERALYAGRPRQARKQDAPPDAWIKTPPAVSPSPSDDPFA